MNESACSILACSMDQTGLMEMRKLYEGTGGIAYYMYANGYYQIAVGDAPRYSNGELHPEDTIRVNDIKEMK